MIHLATGSLRKLGIVSHITRTHRAVVHNPKFLPKYNASVLDKTASEIGTIVNIFGPVDSPYVSFLLSGQAEAEEDGLVSPGDTVFVLVQAKRRKKSKRKR